MMTSRSSLGSRGQQLRRAALHDGRPPRPPARPTISRAISRSSGSRSVSRSRRAVCQLRADGAQLAVVVDDGRQLRLLPAQLAAALGVGRDLGSDHSASICCQAPLDLVEPLLEAHDPVPLGPRGCRGRLRRSSAAASAVVRRLAAASAACARLDVRGQLLASGIGSRSGSRLPSGARLAVGREGLLHRRDGDLDHRVVGLLGGDGLEPDAGQEQPAHRPVLAPLGAPAEHLVGDGRDDRDEQDAAQDADPQVLARRAG